MAASSLSHVTGFFDPFGATAAKRYVPAVKVYSDSKLPRTKTQKAACVTLISYYYIMESMQPYAQNVKQSRGGGTLS